MKPLLITIIVIKQLIQVNCACSYFPIQQISDIQDSYQKIDNLSQEFSYGFWFKYQILNSHQSYPNIQTKIKAYSQSTEGSFILGVIDLTSHDYAILVYLDIPNFNLIIESLKGTLQYSLNVKQVDSIWYFLYTSVYNTQLISILYNTLSSTFMATQTLNYPLDLNRQQVGFQLGGQGTVYTLQKKFEFVLFEGYFSKILINKIQTNQPTQLQLSDCLSSCTQSSQSFNEYQLNGSQSFEIVSNKIFEKAFSFEAWFKFEYIGTSQMYEALRIRVNTQYNETQQLGDQFLLIQYQIQSTQVAVVFTSESYSTPITQNYIFNPQFQIQQIITIDQAINWHYIGFYYDRTQQFQTYIKMYLKNDITYTLNWPIQLYVFTGNNLYVEIGGSTNTQNKFIGQIYQGKLQQCILTNYQINILCHVSCKTCSGPNYFDCLQCDSTLHRTLTVNGICTCEEGYYSVIDTNQCFALTGSNQLQLTQISVTGINCQFGEVKINDKCIKCPSSFDTHLISCIDCLLNATTWIQNGLCTKDYDLVDESIVNSPYKEIENQQQYFIDLSLGLAIICQECDSICSIIGSDCFKSNYYHLNQQINIKCKQGYYFENGYCQFCTSNCIKCSGGICSECIDGYYFQNNQCIKCNGLICQKNNNQVITCPTNPPQTIVNGICVLCGYLCEACQTYQEINRCLRCSSGYHVSLDGINCQQNTIANCQYEYLRAQSGESTISPFFDYNDQVQYFPICLKCTTNLYILKNSVCDTNTVANCNYSIKDGNDIVQCIIGTTIGIQKTTCSINNCQQCVDNYCIICNQGYYSNYYTGLCQKCQSELNCNTCQQEFENVYWEIYAAYKFITGSDLKIQQLKNSQLTVKCLSCAYSYELYNQKCIATCPSNCKQCKIINDQNTCISCIGEYGIIQSQNCVECGQYCQACLPSIRQNISTLNPYFSSDSLHTKYSYMCYKPNDTGTQYNNLFNTFIKCQGTTNCLKVLTLKYKLYCSQTDFTNAYNANSDKEQFSKENYYLNNLNQIFNTFESYEFFQFLNKQSITQMDIYLTLIDNLIIPQCSFSKSITLEQKFSSNVFLLAQVNIILEGSNTILQTFDLNFINFSQLSITGLIFQIQTNKIKIVNALDTNLILTNSKFVSKDNSNVQCLQFDIQNPNVLTINNVEINQAYFSNCQLFNSFKVITIQKLNLISSTFLNFNLIGQLNNLISLTLQDITINSTFTNCTLIHQNNRSKTIINGLIIQSTIYQSILMKFEQCCLTLSSFLIFDSKIQSNTTILEIQQITLQNLNFYNNLMDQSIIINSSSLINSSISMDNLQFSSSDIKQESKLIYIDQINSDFKLNTIKFNELTNTNQVINSHIIIINGQTISIYGLLLNRRIGNPELQLNKFKNITIDYVRITQDPQYFIYLNPSYECFKQYSNNQQYSNIISINEAEQILFNDIKITRMNIFNESFIKVSQVTTLTLQNSVFSDNLLIVTDSQVFASIISVSTDYQANIILSNSYFYNNTLSKYAIDQIYQSSATIAIEAVYSIFTLKQSQFLYNKVFNSTNTILYIKSNKIIMDNLKFSNNNKFNSPYLKSHLASSFPSGTSIESIMSVFPINSLGGNGFLIASNITQNTIMLDSSQASLGGCFYYNMQDFGLLQISNSQFSNTESSLKAYSNSKGGCLYIDGSNSNLVLSIESSKFQQSYSRYGGSIYVLCSNSQCEINLKQIQAFDNVAISGGFIFVDFQEQDQYAYFNDIILRTTSTSVTYLFNYCEQMTSTETKQFFLQGGLITTSKGQVNLNNIEFQNGNTFGGISLILNGGASLNKIKLTNFVDLQNPLILISVSDQFQNNNVILEDIYIALINDDSNYYGGCSTKYYSIPTPQLQCNGNVQSTLNYYSGISSSSIISMNSCNKQQLFYQFDQQIKYNLIKIMNILHTQNSKLILNMITIIDCNVQNVAYSSLFNIAKILESQYQIVKISNVHILNSKFTFGIVLLSYYFSSTNSRLLQQEQNNRLLQTTSTTIPIQIVISQVHMMNNSYRGYLIQSLYLQATFTDIYLINNTNSYEYSISISDKFQRYFNSVVTENIATTQYCSPAIYDEYPLQELIKSKFFVHFNKGNDTDSGDLYEVIQGLNLAYGVNKTQLKRVSKINGSEIIEMIQISPYKILGYSELQSYLTLPSGQQISQYSYYDPYTLQYIPYNLSLYLVPVNRYGQAVPPGKTYATKNCTINQRILDTNNPESELNTNFSFLLNVTIGSRQDFLIDLNSLQITFNPYLEKSKYLQLQFKCPFVKIYKYSDTFPYASSSKPFNYELRANFRTFQCQVGEYFISNQCKQCDPNQQQYSVLANQTQCFLKDDVSTLEVNQSKLNLKSGFWRYQYTSTIIESCYHLKESCLGGWTPGDPSCITGHIGALCEQCDIYNTKGNGSYSVSSQYKCGSCNDLTLNIIIFVLVSLFIIGCALVTVKSSISDTEELLLTRRVKAFSIREAPKGAQATILLKMLTNYFQIIATIFTFQLQLPPEIEITSNGIGNPVESMIYSLECVLATWTSIDIIYFRVIWMILTPFLFIFLILFIYIALVCLRLVKYYVGVLTTTCIYMYIYMQPNIIQGLITLLSRRNISGVDFIQANVSHQFNTYTHYKWCIMLVLPGTLFFAILVPLFLWSRVYSFRSQLDLFEARYKWGYLYNEYKARAYYWETMRLLEKQLIIIGLNYYEDYIPIKASITLLIVFLYQLMSNRVQPFYTVPLNKLDTFSTIVCSISIILCSSIYTASQIGQKEIIWPFYILTALLNVIFILTILKQLITAYFIQFNDKIDRIKEFIKEKLPNQVERSPWLLKCLETQREKQKRVDSRYDLIRKHLRQQSKNIIQGKKQNFPNSPDQVVESFLSQRNQQYFLNNNSPYISRISRISLHRNSTNTNQRPQSPSLDSDCIVSPQAQRVYVNQVNSNIQSSQIQPYFSRVELPQTSVLISPSYNDQDQIDKGIQMQITANNLQMYEYQQVALSDDDQRRESIANKQGHKSEGQE